MAVQANLFWGGGRRGTSLRLEVHLGEVYEAVIVHDAGGRDDAPAVL